MLHQAIARTARTRSNFGTKAKKYKALVHDKKLLARAHKEMCMSTYAIFLCAYDDEADARKHYDTWRTQFQAIAKNKVVTDRDEVASSLLPLQVKCHILLRLAG